MVFCRPLSHVLLWIRAGKFDNGHQVALTAGDTRSIPYTENATSMEQHGNGKMEFSKIHTIRLEYSGFPHGICPALKSFV